MSATINENAVEAVSNQPRSNDPGSFRSHIAPTGPMTNKGHQPGRKVSAKDKAPEFHTKVLPPGSAPEDRTFYPQPVDHGFPPVAKHMNDAELEEDVPITTGEDTIGQTDSVDVDKGLGKPLWGEVSSELRHNGMKKRNREKNGLERVGAGGGGDEVPGKDPALERVD